MGRIILIALAITLVSCGLTKTPCERANKICPGRDSIHVKDSIVYRDSINYKIVVKEKDSVVVRDSFSAEQEIPCVDGAKARIIRGGDVFDVSVKNGKVNLKVNLQGTTSRFSSKIEEKNAFIFRLQNQLKLKNKTKTLPPVVSVLTHVPWWVRVLAWIGGISLLIFAGKYLISKLADGF